MQNLLLNIGSKRGPMVLALFALLLVIGVCCGGSKAWADTSDSLLLNAEKPAITRVIANLKKAFKAEDVEAAD